VKDPEGFINQRMLMVKAQVSDSLFHSAVMVQIQIVKYTEDENFRFVPTVRHAAVVEIVKNTKPIGVVNPIGYDIGEQIRFRILNPIPEFTIGEVSGLIEVASGVVFDREVTPFIEMHIEAWKVSNPVVVARLVMNVTVVDKNDNKPLFTQSKFYKAIDIDNAVGTELMTVTATDADAGQNARIRCVFEIFKV